MVEAVENLILGHLGAMRTDIAEIKTDIIEVKKRLSLVEA